MYFSSVHSGHFVSHVQACGAVGPGRLWQCQLKVNPGDSKFYSNWVFVKYGVYRVGSVSMYVLLTAFINH
jgi:hypothetical protein